MPVQYWFWWPRALYWSSRNDGFVEFRISPGWSWYLVNYLMAVLGLTAGLLYGAIVGGSLGLAILLVAIYPVGAGVQYLHYKYLPSHDSLVRLLSFLWGFVPGLLIAALVLRIYLRA